MPKRSSKDINEIATEKEKNPYAVAIGRLGGVIK